MSGEMESLRRHYGVPAYRGRRIAFTYEDPPLMGHIISARSHKFYIRTDDGKRRGPFHPTWEIEYVAEITEASTTPQSPTEVKEGEDA